MMSERDSFDLTPQQYHYGLDQLWKALGVTGVQDEDVFTLSARSINSRNKLAATLAKLTKAADAFAFADGESINVGTDLDAAMKEANELLAKGGD
jgi:hypothetical protein